MAIKDLIRWNDKGRDVGFQRATDVHPLALHREMNRMLDDVFAGKENKVSAACYTRLDQIASHLQEKYELHPVQAARRALTLAEKRAILASKLLTRRRSLPARRCGRRIC